MARIDLARRAEIGREKRARTRAQIVEAGAMLLAERPLEALTVDAVVEAADGVKAHQANGKKISSTKRCAIAAQRLESALASVRRTP